MESFELLEIEKQLLKAAISGSEETRTYVFRNFRPEQFSAIAEVYGYVQEQYAIGNPDLCTVEALSQLPSFSMATRGIIASLAYTPLIDDPNVLISIAQPILDNFGAEAFLDAIRPVVEDVQDGKIHHRDASTSLLQKLESLNQQFIDQSQIPLTAGRGADIEDAVQRIFSAEGNYYIRSGIKAIDYKIGGFTRGDLVVLGAPSSHGKTLMEIQFLINMALGIPNQALDALFVSMEIQDNTIAHRLVANHSQIPFQRVRETKMDPTMLTEFIPDPAAKARKLAEVEEMRSFASAEYRKIHENLERHGKHLVMRDYGAFNPNDLLRELSIRHYDVVVLDYLNLMQASTATDQDWLRLSNLARELKNIAKAKDLIIITAQQLDEATLDLRYSKAVKEHCDVLIKWVLPPEVQDNGEGMVEMKMVKGRNYGAFAFPLYFDLVRQRAFENGDTSSDFGAGPIPTGGGAPAPSGTADPFGNPFAPQG